MTQGTDLAHITRSLKGAPAALLLALVLHPGPQRVKSLCRYTDYSDKVVRQGLVRLQKIGLVFYDADLRAWYLLLRTELLLVLHQALSESVGPGSPRHLAQRTLSTGRPAEEDFPDQVEDSARGGEELTGGPNAAGQETAVYREMGGEGVTGAMEDSTAGGEEMTGGAKVAGRETAVSQVDAAGNFSTTVVNSTNKLAVSAPGGEETSSASGPIPITTTTKSDPDTREVVSKQGKAPNRRFPGQDRKNSETALAYWLARGGIGRKTPKMMELLASDLDLETVKAHVLERQAWEAGLLPGGPDFLPGLLIHKLLCGDPPPPMRCEACLRLPDKLGLCSCDYDLLVQR